MKWLVFSFFVLLSFATNSSEMQSQVYQIGEFGRLFSRPEFRQARKPTVQENSQDLLNQQGQVLAVAPLVKRFEYRVFGFSTQANGKLGVWISSSESDRSGYLELPLKYWDVERHAVNLSLSAKPLWATVGDTVVLQRALPVQYSVQAGDAETVSPADPVE